MEHTVSISIPTDENGFVGRHCPSCEKYFKIKPGTGLPVQTCQCPYCQHSGESSDFTTPEQREYALSRGKNIAYQYAMKELERSLKRLNSRHFKVKTSGASTRSPYPVRYYTEEDLETSVVCDACGLHFAIYGVFASCPDCVKINAYTIFRKSLEVSKKKMELILQHQEVTKDLLERELKEILSDTVSSFDGLGKALQAKYPALFPGKTKNLFQKLDVLEGVIQSSTGVKLSDKHSNFSFLLKMFQVRHAYVHNMGVIDDDYIKKIPGDAHLLGRKYLLTKEEIDTFTEAMEELVALLETIFTP